MVGRKPQLAGANQAHSELVHFIELSVAHLDPLQLLFLCHPFSRIEIFDGLLLSFSRELTALFELSYELCDRAFVAVNEPDALRQDAAEGRFEVVVMRAAEDEGGRVGKWVGRAG